MKFQTLVTKVSRKAQMMVAALVVSGALLAVPGGSAHAAGLDPCMLFSPYAGTAYVYDSSCHFHRLLQNTSLVTQLQTGMVQQTFMVQQTGMVQQQTDTMQQQNEQMAQLTQQLEMLRATGAPDAQIEQVKAQLDALLSASQLDMINLQSTMMKFNQSTLMISNLTQQYNDLRNNIIANIR